MSDLILDIRSGEDNNSTTSLFLRRVDGSVSFVDGEPIRKGRLSHSIVGGLGDVLFVASGDGEVGVTSRSVSFVKLFELGGKSYYSTGLRDGVVSDVRDENGLSLRVLYSGSVVESDRNNLAEGSADVGVGFWWSRNDVERKRFEHTGTRWSFLGGGKAEDIGVVGDELSQLSSLIGELRVGTSTYRIGSDEFPLVEEGLEENKLSEEGVVGVVLDASGDILFNSGVHIGERVIYIRGEGGFDLGEVKSGDILSPCPSPIEYPLLRDGVRGYMEVRRVSEFSEVVDFGVVELKGDGELKTGHLLSGSLYYDGLVLSESPLSLGVGFDLGFVNGGLDELPVDSVPDGTGLKPTGAEATGFTNNGSGLVWSYRGGKHWVSVGGDLLEVLFVDEFPKRLSVRNGYVLKGSRRVVLHPSWSAEISSRGHSLYIGEVPCSVSRGASQLSSNNWSVSTGTFSLTNGDVVSFTREGVSGSVGVSMEGGHILLEDGFEVSVSSDETVLKGLGLLAGLETGLILELRGMSVRGYYLYEDEAVGQVSGSTEYQLLTFSPRQDFAGYGAGVHFKVGENKLEEGVDYVYSSSPRGFRWVRGRELRGEIREPSSRLFLGHGVIEGSSTLTVRQELTDGSLESQVYAEGVDYDLEGSQITLKSKIGEELTRGVGISSVGSDLVLDGGDLSQLSSGDWVGYKGYFYKIDTLDQNSGVVVLSGSVESGFGVWVGYKGYREGIVGGETPDTSRLSGEVFTGISAGGEVVVYKVFDTLALSEAGTSSFNVLRKGEVDIPLTILREEKVEGPHYTYPLGDVHIASGSYVLQTEGLTFTEGVAQGIYRFIVEGDKFVFQEEKTVCGYLLLGYLQMWF